MGEVIKLKVATSEEVINLKSASGSLAVEAVSPRVSFEKVDGGTRLDITDVEGKKSTIIPDGEKGDSGESYIFDEHPTDNSPNPVRSRGLKSEFDSVRSDIQHYYDSAVEAVLNSEIRLNMKFGQKQDVLTFDEYPTVNSDNPVKSNGIKILIDAIASTIPRHASDLIDDSGHYTKPPQGIPASDLASGVIPSVSDGTTFTPSVSSEGVISWTNDGGRTNPQSVNIKGPQGDDYVLTEQDKEDIAEEVLSDIGVVAPTMTKFVSSGLVSIDDGSNGVPLESCVVTIEPVQSGSGDPASDNVRPISGWTGAKVRRSAENLVDVTKDTVALRGSYTLNNGVITSSSSVSHIGVLIPIKSGVRYNVGLTRTAGGASYSRIYTFTSRPITLSSASEYSEYSRKIHAESVSENGSINVSFTAQDNEAWLFIGMYKSSAAMAFSISDIYANVDGASEFAAYQGNTYDISFPSEAGTVYGGTLDIRNGTLTVDRGNIASYNGETLPGEWISDRDVYAAGTSPTTGAQVVYELAEPIVYSLTPTEITTLLGINNIWADCGDVRVEYFVDTKAYINHKLDKDQGVENAGKALLVGSDGIVTPENIGTIVETVSGTDPVITGADNHRYVCGTCDTLTLTPPSSGIVDVVFTSGTTPTVLTVTPPSGKTMLWPGWFDPERLDASTTYEINIMDGVYGAVATWT